MRGRAEGGQHALSARRFLLAPKSIPRPTPVLLMRHRTRLQPLLAVALFAFAACDSSSSSSSASSSLYRNTIEQSRVLLRDLVASSGTPSLSVALVDRGEIVWAETFGSLDPVQTVAPSPRTKYGIGSCSKVFAAAAISLLADRNALDLDQPVVQYLPTFAMQSPEYVAITPRMLLNHASGLPGTDYLNAVTVSPNPDYQSQALAGIAASRLKFTPGLMSSYCNDGFTVVEAVVAAVSGRSYEQFVREEFFAPLGMVDSEFCLAPSAPGSYAPAFAGSTVAPQEYVQLLGSGGIRSTPSDLARFLTMLMSSGMYGNKRILSKAAVTAMGTDQDLERAIPNFESSDGFGLGWDGVQHPAFHSLGVQVWHKEGETAHYAAQVMAAPAWQLGVAITGVTANYGPNATAEKILLSALVDRGVIRAVPEPIVPTPNALVPADPSLAAQLAGYWISRDAAYRIVTEPQGIGLETWDGAAWLPYAPGLALRANGWWQSDAEPIAEFAFRSAQGRTYMVERFPNGNGHYLQSSTKAERVESRANPLSPAWTARIARRWAVVNERADTITTWVLPAQIQLSAGPGVQGCLQVDSFPTFIAGLVLDASQSDTEARMMLQIPFLSGRDLQDLRVFSRGGEEWLRLGSVVARPVDTIPLLANGQVVIAADGYGEWRRIPAGAQWAVQGEALVRRYDADFLRLPDDAPQPLYVLISGAPGAIATTSTN